MYDLHLYNVRCDSYNKQRARFSGCKLPEMDSSYQFTSLIDLALEHGAFGELDPDEEAFLRLRRGSTDPSRDLDEIAVKLGRPQEWLSILEEALILRLRESPLGPALSC